MKRILIGMVILATLAVEDAEAKKKKIQLVEISTSHGIMVVYLYDETPKHKENFLKLTSEGFYNGTAFHRIIKRFMIQGGDPNTKSAEMQHMAGQGGPGYTIEAEIIPGMIHRKGVLAAARMGDQVNPTKASSGSQFYIVQGDKLGDNEIMMALKRRQIMYPDFNYTEEQKEVYKTIGGSPWLDGEYTIFGEVIQGIEVIDLIANVKTVSGDRPEEPLVMNAKIIEVSAKELEKKYNFEIAKPAKKK